AKRPILAPVSVWGKRKDLLSRAASRATTTRATQTRKKASASIRGEEGIQLLLLLAGQLLFDLANQIVLFSLDLRFGNVKRDCGITHIDWDWRSSTEQCVQCLSLLIDFGSNGLPSCLFGLDQRRYRCNLGIRKAQSIFQGRPGI